MGEGLLYDTGLNWFSSRICMDYFPLEVKQPLIIKIIKTHYPGRRGHDRMVIGFTTTYVTSVYHP